MQRIAIGIWLAATAAACTVEDETEEPTGPQGFAAAPLAAIELETGVTVEFYEPLPGSLLVMESGEAGGRPLGASSTQPVDLYRALAPGHAVPDALLQAQARRDAIAAEHADADADADAAAADAARMASSLPLHVATAEVDVAYINNQSCDDHWFDDEWCFHAQWSMCLLNHWDGAYASSGGVNLARYTTCADIGNITLKIVAGDGDGGIWDVLEGNYRSYYWVDLWDEEATRGDILNANNNRFHFAVQYTD